MPEIVAELVVGLIIFVIVLIFVFPIIICRKIANHKLKKDKEKEEEEKEKLQEKIKDGSGNFEIATIIEKEVKRPFMRAVAIIARPIFIIFIINYIWFNVFCFWCVFEEKYEVQEAAKKVTDEEWEMYENYLDEDKKKVE